MFSLNFTVKLVLPVIGYASFRFHDAGIKIEADKNEQGVPIKPKQNGKDGAKGAVKEVVIAEIGKIVVHHSQNENHSKAGESGSCRKKPVFSPVRGSKVVKRGDEYVNEEEKKQPLDE